MPDGSLTTNCLAELSAYAPDDPGQQRLRAAMVGHLRTRAAGWSRSCSDAHLTASAIIVSPAVDRVLLIRHRKLGRWLQTGGHIEPTDATLAGAALREAREESGLTALDLVPGVLHLDRHLVRCGSGPQADAYHLDVRFLIVAEPTQPVIAATAEASAGRWFCSDDLPTEEESVTVLVTLAHRRLA